MNIQVCLKSLHKLGAAKLVDTYKEWLQINIEEYDEAQLKRYDADIIECQKFLAKNISFLKTFKDTILQFAIKQKKIIYDYQAIPREIKKYENFNLRNYSNNNVEDFIFVGENNKKTVDQLENMSKDLSNQYIDLHKWAQGELYDL